MAESSVLFTHTQSKSSFLSARENQEALLQWNLTDSLTVEKFLFSGPFISDSSVEYERLLKDFFCRNDCLAAINIFGTPSSPTAVSYDVLDTSIMSMEFFDRMLDSDLVTSSGNIRGCFDEVFDGITVGDKLREFLLNEDSENAALFSMTDRNQFIFSVFKIFAVGGSMCQPDSTIQRYLDFTKAFYKDLITVYRDSKTEKVQVSGRVFRIKSVSGLDLFTHTESSHNSLYILVDPLKKTVTALKGNFKPYWNVLWGDSNISIVTVTAR